MNRDVETLTYYYKRWKYYYGEMTALLRFVIPNDVSLVHIGANLGHLLSALGAKEKVGIDSSEEVVSEAKKKFSDIEFIQDDIDNLKTSRTFDYALLSEITDTLRDVPTTLSYAKSLIRERGRLVIVSRSRLWQPLFALARVLGFSKPQSPFRSLVMSKDLQNMLYLSGFEVVRKGRGVLCPFYIPLISFLLNRIVAPLPFFNWFGLIQYVVARPILEGKKDVSVSVIIAARNERGNIEEIVKRIPQFAPRIEIVFIEGHSKDGTWDEIERVQSFYRGSKIITALKQKGVGKGDAVHQGFLEATGELLMILDADMTVMPEDLPKFYNAFIEGKGDFINGARLIYPMERGAMRFLNKIGNRFFAKVVGITIGERLTDALCGTKVFLKSDYLRIKKVREYLGSLDPFGDFDLLFGAGKLNLKIVELPVRYKDRTYGTTQIDRFPHGFLLLRMCLVVFTKFRFRL